MQARGVSTCPSPSSQDPACRKPTSGEESLREVWSSDDGLWLAFSLLKGGIPVLRMARKATGTAETPFRGEGRSSHQDRCQGTTGQERVALDHAECSSDVAAAFSICGKRYTKLSILGRFNCILHCHEVFHTVCNHHHHPSTKDFHLSKWKLHLHSVMCDGCILRSK